MREIAGVFGIGLILLLCPGYALLVISKVGQDYNLGERLCASVGLSVAVIPLVLYVCTVIGLRLTPRTTWGFLMLSGGVCLWDWQRRFSTWRRSQPRSVAPAHLLLGIVLVITLCARLWMVRDITYPLWTDSYHHTLITHLIADAGRVPSSYEPYAPVDRFTYHFGFHALVTWFHWLSGSPVPRSVVLVGQVINALAVPTCYLLTWRLFQSRAAGVVASLVVGLVSHMPALFVNWGRYPQLSGQIVLPVLMVLTMDALYTPKKSSWILTGLGAAGLFLIHNRVFLFYVLFAALVFLFRLAGALRQRKVDQVRFLIVGSVVIGSVMLIVTVPWLWRFYTGFGSIVLRELGRGYHSQRDSLYFAWRFQDLIDYGVRWDLLILAVIGGLGGLFKREVNVYLIVIWIAGMFAAANCYLIDLTPLVSNVTVIILMYLPAAMLIGYLVSGLVELATRYINRRSWVFRVLQSGVATGFVLAVAGGMVYTAGLAEPDNGFVRPADLKAMDWIRQNVPQDALFHTSARFWTPVVVHGLDAGYWIPLLARRQTTIPLETYASDGTAEYIQFVNQRARELVEADTPQHLWQVMTEYGVTHIYIGKRQTNLRPDFFLAAPAHFSPQYSQDDVWVFQVLAEGQAPGG